MKKVGELVAEAETGPLWKMTLPILSTAVLSEESGGKLLNGEYPWMQVAQYETGFFLKIDKRPDYFGEQPDDLNKLIEWSVARSFEWVRLDADGDSADGLDEYDW